ncbi:MAG TPA: ABC transporter substrate-binding protein [Chthonomonadaceae bacterium]|nr:ABC transporter substrate-binding protein [Chthonomonadaceae bacterium]
MKAEENGTSTRRQWIRNAVGITAATALGGYAAFSGGARRIRKGRKEVRLWHLLGAEWLEPVERAVARYNESQSRYEVVPLLITDSEADSKLLLSVAGNDPPDVMLVWTQGTSVWGSGGLLQPLDTFMTPEERQRFLTEAYPVVRKSGWYRGHLYGITMGFDLFVCYYRPEHFREAGLDPDRFPATLEEVVEVGKKLDRFDSSKHITRLGFLPQTWENYVASFGGNFYDEKTGQVTLNTPENLRALEFLVETRKRLGLNEVIRFQSGLPSDSGASWPFISGTFSITVDGEWRVEQMRRSAPKLEYRTIPIPPPAGGKSLASFSSINYLVIPRGARNPEGGWEFTKFWTGLDDPEAAAEFFPWYGWMPLFPRSAKTPVYEAWLKTVPQYRTFLRVAESENIVTTPPVPYQLYLMDWITRADDLAMRGTLTPRQALEQLEADVARERQRRRDLGYAE